MGLEKCCVGQEEKGWEREESTGHAAMRERGGQQSYDGQSSMEKGDPHCETPGERFACVDGLIWMTGRLLGCKSRGWGLGRRWCLRPAASRTGCGMSTNRMVWMTGVAGKQPSRCTYAVAREGIRNQTDTGLEEGREKKKCGVSLPSHYSVPRCLSNRNGGAHFFDAEQLLNGLERSSKNRTSAPQGCLSTLL